MPLSFDLPLDELQTYNGRNPRPADFDAFWDDGLAELRAIDPQVTLEPADFQTDYADCFDMTFTGTAGARVHAQLLRPREPQEGHPAVIKFHGYSANAGGWSEKLGYVAAGFTVSEPALATSRRSAIPEGSERSTRPRKTVPAGSKTAAATRSPPPIALWRIPASTTSH